MTVSAQTAFGVALAAITVTVVAGGFRLVGSPGEARVHRMDSRRAADLRELRSAIDMHFQQRKTLPSSVEGLGNGAWQPPTKDPVTGQLYSYRVIGDRQFELCATFARASEESPTPSDPVSAHTSGRQCFLFEAWEGRRR